MSLKRISGLWLKDGKSGKFMSGNVQESVPAGAKLMVFKNQNKRGDKDPDYTLHVADDEEQGGAPRSTVRRTESTRSSERDSMSSF